MNKARIAADLRRLRGSRSREEVALACGVSSSAISMYETGARIPSDDVKQKIATYYGKRVGEIFFNE